MVKYAYVLYNSKSSVTGKALWKALKAAKTGGYEWRHSSSGKFGKTPSLVLRWGSAQRIEGDFIEVNPRDAVYNASSKKDMMRLLVDAVDVPTPAVEFHATNGVQAVAIDGYAYVRDAKNKVRYTNLVLPGDKYILAPIDKESEYRVHVFDNKVTGVYRKVPHNANVRLYKNDTCDFVRLDQSQRDLMRGIKGVRPAALKATEALGLRFSGVDVLRAENGDVFVNEVNSAPALNEPNVLRWVNTINGSLSNEVAAGVQAVADREVNAATVRRERAEVEAERLREEERLARQRLEAQRAEAERLRLVAERRETARVELREFFSAEAQRRGFTVEEVFDN
jgi:hypothetical protein